KVVYHYVRSWNARSNTFEPGQIITSFFLITEKIYVDQIDALSTLCIVSAVRIYPLFHSFVTNLQKNVFLFCSKSSSSSIQIREPNERLFHRCDSIPDVQQKYPFKRAVRKRTINTSFPVISFHTAAFHGARRAV
ncbi:hypothetical protein J4Q44_G00341740, partial [Coregonus suidteri]